jgi:DNA polymerase III subunit delta'
MAKDSERTASWDQLEGIPDAFENLNLVGHDLAIDRLVRGYASGRMHHAWLVTGPRGIGKATLAARFACHVFRHPDPIQAPTTCRPGAEDDHAQRQVAQRSHPNLLHLRRPWNDRDKRWRSEITVDEVRKTVRFFGTAAAGPSWRVAIVDTADDLNRSAANALLKILEEPPARTMFLLLAHAGDRVAATIRSRCQRLSLRPLSREELLVALDHLGQGRDLSSADQTLLAELAGGSVRRAILLLCEDGLQLYRRMIQMIDQPGGLDWAAIDALAAEISPTSRDERYRLFLGLVHDHIARIIRGKVENRSSGRSPDVAALAGWVEVWEKTRQSADRTDAYNLDRKQVILNLFAAIERWAGPAAGNPDYELHRSNEPR